MSTWRQKAMAKDSQVRNLAAKVAELEAENERLRENLPEHNGMYCCAAFEALASHGCIDCMEVTYLGDNHAFDRDDMAQWRWTNCTEDDEIAAGTFGELLSIVANLDADRIRERRGDPMEPLPLPDSLRQSLDSGCAETPPKSDQYGSEGADQ